ncbi:MAG: hypothetical protein KDA61_17520, partial [Planctomycetales bacterium]|nr:hypothetical protein [Planctomycetales bacterium]
YDLIGVVGGDGTVHEAVNGMLERSDGRRVPLGLLPTGTGNTVHADLGCAELNTSVRWIVEETTMEIDVAEVRCGDVTSYCVNIVGWGAVADVNRLAERLRFLGKSRYAVAAACHIARPQPLRARLTLDDETLDGEFLFVIACNTRTTGAGMRVAPAAQLSDGKFDVVVCRPMSRIRLLQVFLRVFSGAHVGMEGVVYRQVTRFSWDGEPGSWLNLDGELRSAAPVVAVVRPRALQVYGKANACS